MKVLVTGDREWTDVETVVAVLAMLPLRSVIVEGEARGADITCRVVAEEMGHEVRGYPADWDRFRRAAGPIRNQQMLDCEHRPDEPIELGIAFHDDLAGKSRGTRDMVNRLQKAGIPWVVVASSEHSDRKA